MTQQNQPAGWSADPTRHAQQRYWSGTEWTKWVSDGYTVTEDRFPVPQILSPENREHLSFIREVFLPEAVAAHFINESTLGVLTNFAEAVGGPTKVRVAEATTAGARPTLAKTVTAAPVPRPEPTGLPLMTPRVTPPHERPKSITPHTYPTPAPRQTPPPRRPPEKSKFSKWWDRTRQAISSDLGVHGLAYLGVLLLFAGSFGLVAFAFGEVQPTFRPIAEIAIVLASFGASWLLLRRGARIAGRACELAGGLLLPIMLITAFLDGVAFPPDLTGRSLLITLTALLAVVSGAYAFWSSRHPASALRFLVAPAAWLAVGIATMGIGQPIPSGRGVAHISLAQSVSILAAMVVTTALAKFWSKVRLAEPTTTAGLYGLIIMAVVGPLTLYVADWPVAGVLLIGTLALILLELLDTRIPSDVIAVVEPIWWAGVSAALLAQLEMAPTALVGVIGFLAILELNAWRRPHLWSFTLAGVGLAVSLALTVPEPWIAFGACAALAVWAQVRRMRPFDIHDVPHIFDAAAAVLPIAAFAALGHALDEMAVFTVCCAALVLVATWPATHPVWRRSPTDDFWRYYWAGTGIVAIAASVVIPIIGGVLSTTTIVLTIVSLVALASAAAVGPIALEWRPWPVAGLLGWAWIFASTEFDWPVLLRGGVAAGAALALVVGATALWLRRPHAVLSHTVLVGHVLGLAAIFAAGLEWGLPLTVGLATAGLLVTTLVDTREDSPVRMFVPASDGEWVRFIAPILTVIGIPTTVSLVLWQANVFATDVAWRCLVPCGAALLYALLVRVAPDKRLRLVLTWSTFAFALIGVTFAAAVAVPDFGGTLSTTDIVLTVVSLVMLATAAAVGPIKLEWRPWPVAALLAWAWIFASTEFDWSVLLRGGVVAGAALALVVGATALWLRRPHALFSHTVLVGHVLGLAAIFAAGLEWGLPLTVGLATAGLFVTTLVDTREDSPVRMFMPVLAGEWARFIAPILTVIGIPTTVGLILWQANAYATDMTWRCLVPCGTALLYAALIRVAPGDRLRLILTWSAFTFALVGVAFLRSPWSAVAALGTLIAVVLIIPSARRHLVMTWTAWLAVTPMLALAATQLWTWLGNQPTPFVSALSLIGIGGAMTLGAALFDLRGRPWAPRYLPERVSALPPYVIGALEVFGGLTTAIVLVASPADGWFVLAVACVVLAFAAVMRIGMLAGVSALLGWAAVLMLAGDTISQQPWISIGATMALLALAEGANRLISDRTWWVRADIGLLAVAHVTAITALRADTERSWIFVVIGALAWVVAARLWRQKAAAITYGVVGFLLVMTGSAMAGPGWLALALAVLGVTLTAVATRIPAPTRWALQIGSVIAFMAAWGSFGVWLDWSEQMAVNYGAGLAAGLALAAAGIASIRRLDKSWSMVWLTAMVAVVVGIAAITTAGTVGGTSPHSSEWTISALLATSVAIIAAAAPLAVRWMVDVGVVGLVAGELQAFSFWDVDVNVRLAVLGTSAFLSAVAILLWRNKSLTVGWLRPLLDFGLLSLLAMTVISLRQLPDTMALAPTLMVAAAFAAAIGVALRSVGVLALAPIFACGSWLVFATNEPNGNPQWYSLAIGLALFAVVALLRRDARQHGGDQATPVIIMLEMVALATMVLTSWVQSFTDSLGYAGIAMAIGIAVGVLGLFIQVRRRLFAGAVIVLVSIGILIVVPLVHVLPGWSGAWMWTAIGIAGLIALLFATLLEEGRVAIRKTTARVRELTQGWE